MELGLAKRTALVTGASRGLGRPIALQLAKQGMNVVLVARDQARLEGVQREIEAAGGVALVEAADLSQPARASEIIAATIKRFGSLYLLVNNAGATKRGDFLELSDADWTDGFALKFFGAVRMAKSAWPHVRQSKGTIINIGGVGGRVAEAEFAIGGSVNAAIGLLTKALADRGVRDGVRVLAIHPGTFETDRLTIRVDRYPKAHNVTAQEAYNSILREQGIRRFGRPEELAIFIGMLASNAVEFLQGSVIDMDGGQTRAV